MDLDQFGFLAILLLAGGFLAWFVIGGEYNRRRAGRLAQWVYQGLKPLLGKASVRWLTTHAFEVLVDDAQRPFSSMKATGLLESRDMLAIWLYNRFAYRPDVLVIRGNLRRKPLWGCEAFRPRTILSGDARQAAETEGWSQQARHQRRLETWHSGEHAAELCARLIAEVDQSGFELIRLAVHRAEPHLVLAVSVARFASEDPHQLFETFKRLAETTEEYAG